MARTHILVVPENPWEIPQSWDIQFSCSEILEKYLICWKDPRNMSMVGNTLVLSVIKFQMGGDILQCIFWIVPVYLITKYNYTYVILLRF